MGDLNLEERRCERLRNLLSPMYNLAQMIESNEDGNFDELIKKESKKALENWDLIEIALTPSSTLDELNKLYHDPENRRK